ncbi:MAG: ABC transporter permease [Deltaproteobacteria bacterium]|nr:ABC transporter permease [Deltaproteobacteria bacterium]MBW2122566.1 ABC transporter permease [Deltaproteobacteria bacterium]
MFLRFLRRSPLSAKIGLGIVLLNVVACVLAPVLSPYGETEIAADVWLPPSRANPLGTDQLGRDMLTRLLYGARNTISLALVITVLSFSIGIISGFLAGVVGGWVDQLLSRVVDIIMAFPTLIFALMILSVLGTSLPILIAVIAILDSTRVYRLSRALGMDIEVMEYVEVARLRGEGLWWVMRHEILPNAWPPLLAEFGMRFCFVFLFIAALSFLGLGIQPPTADWGGMVRENAGAITFGILTPIWPAGSIAFLTIGVNLVVDWFLYQAGLSRDQL